jgi:hypothetical protein
MGHFENPWGMTPKQELAHGIKHLTQKQEAAHTPHITAEEKEYDFSGAESVFGGESDEESEPKRDEPAKH